MGKHQNDASAVQLWTYFQAVIEWVKAIFPKARKEMKGLSWGLFYNDNKDKEVVCNFCNKKYSFNEEQILDLFNK